MRAAAASKVRGQSSEQFYEGNDVDFVLGCEQDEVGGIIHEFEETLIVVDHFFQGAGAVVVEVRSRILDAPEGLDFEEEDVGRIASNGGAAQVRSGDIEEGAVGEREPEGLIHIRVSGIEDKVAVGIKGLRGMAELEADEGAGGKFAVRASDPVEDGSGVEHGPAMTETTLAIGPEEFAAALFGSRFTGGQDWRRAAPGKGFQNFRGKKALIGALEFGDFCELFEGRVNGVLAMLAGGAERLARGRSVTTVEHEEGLQRGHVFGRRRAAKEGDVGGIRIVDQRDVGRERHIHANCAGGEETLVGSAIAGVAVDGPEEGIARIVDKSLLRFLDGEFPGLFAMAGGAGAAIAAKSFLFEEELAIVLVGNWDGGACRDRKQRGQYGSGENGSGMVFHILWVWVSEEESRRGSFQDRRGMGR